MAPPRSAPRHAATPQQQQVRAVYAALKSRDFGALEELAFSRGGFYSSELRRGVWMCLLGLAPQQAVDPSWKRVLAEVDHQAKEARVMHADVQRSVYSWDVHSNMRKTTRNQKRIQLSEVMHAILRRHSGKLTYFQGFHDIALVFLEVGTQSQAFHMAERLALFHLTDQLCLPFDQGLTPLLGVLFCLLQLLDAPLAEALDEAGCAELHFAVPWVLTWFAHSLPRLHQQVMRLFDCLIAGHPAMILYFSAALLMEHREAVLAAPRDLPDVALVIQGLPLDSLDVDEWAATAWSLAKRLPPDELLRRLPAPRRRALPATSPLMHFPHAWMPQARARAGAPSATLADEELRASAPVYAPPRRFGGCPWSRGGGPGSLLTSRAAWLLSTFGVAGAVVLAALALAGRARIGQ